jgi:putative protease
MGLFSKKPKEPKPVGVVTHFYGGIGVVIVKFNKVVKVGDRLHFKGATTDFEETVKSMQYDHKDIKQAKKGQEVGIKVKEKAREGDKVYLVE